jgi:hypothetical protein
MSEREYTVTVTLKRTFKRKVQSAKHRAEVVSKIERALRGDWSVAKATIRTGASKTQKAKTKKKVKAKAQVRRVVKQEQRLSHIAPSLPEREFMAEVLKKEGLEEFEVRKARNGGGRYLHWKRRILVGPTDLTEPGYMGYARLRAWAAKEGIDIKKVNRPLKVFLHEVAHACDYKKNPRISRRVPGKKRTPHGKPFRRELRRLLKKYAPQVFGLPVRDARTAVPQARAATR